MIDSFIANCMRNRLIVLIVAAVVAVIGIRIAYITPVDAIPDLSENQVIVFADWMGRSPKEIEDQVTYPLSVSLQGLAGVKAVRSSSEFNFSMINVIFEDSIDFYFSRQRVLEKLSTANTFLPQGVVPYMAPDATALGQIFWYTVDGKGVDLDKLRAIQDWYVRYQLNSVPGVSQVATVGGSAREYQIDVDPQKLRAYGITLGDVSSAVSKSNSSVGGRVIHKGNAEYLIRSVGWIQSIRDIENIIITTKNMVPIYVRNVAKVQLGPEFKRSVLEKEGGEAVGGVVMMRFGENPLEVTQRVKEKIRTLQSGLPEGVSIVPFYDRTALIQRAIHTLTGTLTEELIVTSLVVLFVMGHLGASIAVCLSLPLAVLVSLILMHYFNISSNIMSLSGIAISIGVIVDQSVVMVDNAAHSLYYKFEGKEVTGDNTEFLVPHCQSVGRPIFFSVLIMIVSFLPVFALGGMEGKMFHPLAFTKVFAFIGVSIISISFVPAILPWFIRGKLYKEEDNWVVRQFIEIYRPVLKLLMDRPKLVVWFFVLILSFGWLLMGRLGREFMPVLDEGSSLEMPITVPRASVTETADDIRVRDAIIMQVPEVEQVVGKSGRADTPTDPSPLDMIETIINFCPQEHWPKRQVYQRDAEIQAQNAVAKLSSLGFFNGSATSEVKDSLGRDVGMEELPRFDAAMRAFCLQRKTEYYPVLGTKLLSEFQGLVLDHARSIGKLIPTSSILSEGLPPSISDKFVPIMARGISLEETDQLLEQVKRHEISVKVIASDTDIREEVPSVLSPVWDTLNTIVSRKKKDISERFHEKILNSRFSLLQKRTLLVDEELFHFAADTWAHLEFDAIVRKAAEKGLVQTPLNPEARMQMVKNFAENFKSGVFLWKKNKALLVQEMDLMLLMPGWGNIWTQPIINRIDMLSTGVRTMIGVKVFGNDIQEIQVVSEKIADILKTIPGAVDVFPDQNVGKGYIEIQIDREKAGRYGVAVGDIQETVEAALGGRSVTTTVEGRERFPVRVRYARDFREDEQQVRKLLVSGNSSGGMVNSGMEKELGSGGGMGGGMGGGSAKRNMETSYSDQSSEPLQVPLSSLADVRVVEGPAMIKSENGLLRSYVQLNVRDRDIVGFVEEAQRAIATKLTLPQGMYIEWSGQFEHQIRARRTLSIVFPLVILIIFVILYITYHDLADALLMMLAVPGALAGGIIFQYLLGFNFSVAVWVGYIACFGMATETGIIMLVYLRLAIEEKGGLEKITSLDELKDTIIKGAVHRLRPKLLTEGTTIIGLAPMLWATGTGAEIIRPMAAPVLGGILFADEVIDLFLPVLFYVVRKRRWLALQQSSKSI